MPSEASPKGHLLHGEGPELEDVKGPGQGLGEEGVLLQAVELVAFRQAVGEPSQGVAGVLGGGAVGEGPGGGADGGQGGLQLGDPLQGVPHQGLLQGELGLVGQGEVGGRG